MLPLVMMQIYYYCTYYAPTHLCQKHNKYDNPQPGSYRPLPGLPESHAEPFRQQRITKIPGLDKMVLCAEVVLDPKHKLTE